MCDCHVFPCMMAFTKSDEAMRLREVPEIRITRYWPQICTRADRDFLLRVDNRRREATLLTPALLGPEAALTIGSYASWEHDSTDPARDCVVDVFGDGDSEVVTGLSGSRADFVLVSEPVVDVKQ